MVHRLRCRVACRGQTRFEFVVSRFRFELTFVRRRPASYYLGLAYKYPRVWPRRARQPRPISLLYFCMLQLLPDRLTDSDDKACLLRRRPSFWFCAVSFTGLACLIRPPHVSIPISTSCLATDIYLCPANDILTPRRQRPLYVLPSQTVQPIADRSSSRSTLLSCIFVLSGSQAYSNAPVLLYFRGYVSYYGVLAVIRLLPHIPKHLCNLHIDVNRQYICEDIVFRSIL